MSDGSILHHISALVNEERRVREADAESSGNSDRLRAIQVELDQCWDLLRQREAKREFGRDPGTAVKRDARTVEGYEG